MAGTEFGVCVVVLIMTNILSNFMSNNAAVTIVMPITLSLAQTLEYNLPLAIACRNCCQPSAFHPDLHDLYHHDDQCGELYRFKTLFSVCRWSG